MPIDVKTYGATADGTTDDGPAFASAITAALAAVPATNGGGAFTQGTAVYVPAGRYRIATPIVVNLANAGNTTTEARRRLSLVGDGKGHSVLLNRVPANTHILQVRGGALDLDDLTISGDGSTTSYGIQLGADNTEAAPFVNQFRIRGVQLEDMARFVTLTWAFDGTFESCSFGGLSTGGIGVLAPAHSTDNCNNIHFVRCHWEPALGGGTMLRLLGGAGSAAREHSMWSFTGCHFETRAYNSYVVEMERVNRVSFIACQMTQNADPGTVAASASVPLVRLSDARQVHFTASHLARIGTGFSTRLLRLGGRNKGLAFASCFLQPGDNVYAKNDIWESDPAYPYENNPTPFVLHDTNIQDNYSQGPVPDEIDGVTNAASVSEQWTWRFNPTSKGLVFAYGAGGVSWANSRTDRFTLYPDGRLGLNGLQLRNNAGVLQKSTNGTTWTTIG